LKDTIAAISTPRGFGGIGIIRMSGKEAKVIAEKVFSRNLEEPGRAYAGIVFDPNTREKIDTCVGIYYKAPHSYTGEDVVELQMHGGIKNLEVVLGTLLNLGSRLAERGEFTRRAFLNGKMDLLEASAVIELIEAKTDRALKIASKRLFGEASGKIDSLKEKVLNLLSVIEGSIDFPFDVENVEEEEILKRLEEIREEIQLMLSSYRIVRKIRDGVNVVIAGKPNVGKSTLLNTLLRFERAIVSETPGTTRDTVEEVIDFYGFPVKLIDTAGVRESPDKIEALGMERTLKAIEESDLVLFVFDAAETLSSEDIYLAHLTEGRERIIVLNKMDLPYLVDREELENLFKGEEIIETSALKKQGIEELERMMLEHISPVYIEDGFIADEREKGILTQILGHIEAAISISGKGGDELIAEELKEVISKLGVISGEGATEDILDEIFLRFCIGK